MLFYVLLIFTLLKGISADKCYQSGTGGGGLTFTCNTKFAGKDAEISIELDTCREKPKISFSIEVKALDVDWSETFDESADIPIPGFSVPVFGGVFLKIEIASNSGGNTNLKMSLHVKAIINIVNIPLIDEPIGKSSCNAFLYWWNSQHTGIKSAVGGGGGLFLILLLVCCCKCCCCKKKNNQQHTTLVMAPPTGNNVMINNTIQQQQQQQYTPMPPMGQDPYGVSYKKF